MLTKSERETHQRLINKYLEQFEQLHATLGETIGQAESLNFKLESIYDQLMLRPEHERMQHLKPLLDSMPINSFNELQQHVQHLVVALQSNRADIDVQLRRCYPPDELRTRRLTRPILLHTLQSFTALLERISLNTRQLHSRLKRIVGKQLKRFHVSLTDRLLERLLHIETDETLLKLDRFAALVFGVASPNLPAESSSPIARNPANELPCSTENGPIRSSVSNELKLTTELDSSNPSTVSINSDNRLDAETTSVLWSFCRLVSQCYLSLSGLCVALHTLFEFFAGLCEFFFANRLIAEIEELPFVDIFDFTARIANKMRTDHLKEHEQPILIHTVRKQELKQKQLRIAILVLLFLFLICFCLLFITFVWFNYKVSL